MLSIINKAEEEIIADADDEFEEGYSDGWYTVVRFSENPAEEKIEEAQAREVIAELLEEAKGDFSIIEDYINSCKGYEIDFDINDLAKEMIPDQYKI